MNLKNNRGISVAMIGAGISGLSCATRLQNLGYHVEIFEKSRGPGGRMSTRHGDDWSADHGAQYFTARDPLFVSEVDRWINAQVAAPWKPHIMVFENESWRENRSKDIRYVGTPKMNSPSKYLADKLTVTYNQTIENVERIENKWSLSSKESGTIPQRFDWVIFSMPASQTEVIAKKLDQNIEKLTNQAQMNGCWTLMAQFQEKQSTHFDAAFINQEIISWMCRNNSKPSRPNKESWTIHANPAWSQTYIELPKEEVATLILECAKKLGLDCQNAEISTHRWRYANGSISTMPGFYINPELNLGICGDWLNGGRVEGAWLSGYQLASQINL